MNTMPGIASALVLAAATATTALGDGPRTETYQNLDVLTQALRIVHDQYVEPRPMPALVTEATLGLLGGVDTDAALLTPADRQRLAAEDARSPAGLGLVFTRRRGILTVVAPLPDGPGARAGLAPGDRILTIDGTSTVDLQVWQALERTRGAAGTAVKLRVFRDGWPEPREIEVPREVSRGPLVRAHDLGDGMVRMEVRRAHDDVADEIAAVLARASQPPAGIVLDLRNVAGGSANLAAGIAGPFLEKGQLVASAVGRREAERREVLAHTERGWRDVPLVVLVSQGTAGAAEVAAAALQDWHRAVILGTKTSGLARERTRLVLADGTTLEIATARDVTPRGHPIDGVGVTPDIVVPEAGDHATAAGDVQLQRALEVLHVARVVEHQRAG